MTDRPEHQDDESPTAATSFVPPSEIPATLKGASPPAGRSDRYDLLEKISDGGQAVIYKARDRKDGGLVAIKLFKTIDHDPQAEQRVRSEMEILVSLKHPNIINEMGTVEIEDEWGAMRRGMVMEYLDGMTMKEWVAQNPKGTPWHTARPIMEQCIAGLEYAWTSLGVVHRDIKPSNIIIRPDGTVKLIDFGVAHTGSEDTRSSSGLLGSFDYMAPEFAGTDVSFRGDVVSDIFGLFVCFYELLTGKLPFSKFGERPDIEYMARWKGTPPQISHAHIIFRVMAQLSKFIDRGLAMGREKRFPSYPEVLEQLKLLKKRVIVNGNDQYLLLEGLGAGAFGEVFKARRMADNQFVAIKRLFPDRSGDKFIKEARILAKTQYPGVVKYIDFFQSGTDSGAPSYFLVMEYLDGMPGSSLRDRIRSNASGLPLAEVIPTFLQYVSAIGQLHYQGIIHRDIKPANLYARKDTPEMACILDLGVARDLSGTKTTGSVPGSWDYMAPELLAENTRGSVRSDLYALGLSLYEAITGSPAYPRLPKDDREAYPELIARAKGTSTHAISYTDSVFEIYPELAKIISRVCANRPEDRPNDARAFFNEILEFGVSRLKLDAAAWKDRAPPAMPEVRGTSQSRGSSVPAISDAAAIPTKKSKAPVLGLAAVAVLAAAAAGWWWMNRPAATPVAVMAPSPGQSSAVASTPNPEPTPPPKSPEVKQAPATPAVNPEAAEIARQIEMLYRLYPVSFGYESFERDIYQRVRSLNDQLQGASTPAVWEDPLVVNELKRFWSKMAEFALTEAAAQNNALYYSVVRECVFHGVKLLPADDRDGISRASDLFKTWQAGIPRLATKLPWPVSNADMLTWRHEPTEFHNFMTQNPDAAEFRAVLLPARLDTALNAVGGRGVAERSLTLSLALVPDARFPAKEKYVSPSSPFYMAVIETPVEALRIYRDDVSRLAEDQRKWASGMIDPQKTQGRADVPYDKATPEEAMEFCNWLSIRAGLPPVYERGPQGWKANLQLPGFRLPTVSEWMMAARCGMDFLAMPGQSSWSQLAEALGSAPSTSGEAVEGDREHELIYFLYKREPRSSAHSPEYPLGFRDLAGNVAELCMADPPASAHLAAVAPEFVTKGGNAASKAVAAVLPEFRGGSVDDLTGMIGFRIILPLPFAQFETIMTEKGGIQ